MPIEPHRMLARHAQSMRCRAMFVLLLLQPAVARAQSGINLSWDDCGVYGTELKTFACDSNSGAELLVVSAAVSPAISQINAVEVSIDVVTSEATLSPWWHFESGGCHFQGLHETLDFAQFTHCHDVWTGQATGATNYTAGFSAPNSARLRGVAAIRGTVASTDGTEMYVFGISILHSKSAGTGACSGCSDAACFALGFVKLDQPIGVGDVFLSNPLARTSASWKCEGNFGTDMPTACMVSCQAPARKPSWGTIKSLYR